MKSIRADFAETPYGIVKRLRVIEHWLQSNNRRLRILDFGCGTGEHVTFPLANAGHHVLGVDTHVDSIVEASRRYQLPNLEFRTIPPDGLFEGISTFDVVICSEVLEHFEDPARLLGILREAIRPEGLLIVTAPNGRGPYEILCFLERILKGIGVHAAARRLIGSARTHRETGAGFLNLASQHVQFFTLGELEKLFRRTGFEILDRRPRTLLCGPYVDLLFRVVPGRRLLVDLNARFADVLPMWCAADWMFLMKKS